MAISLSVDLENFPRKKIRPSWTAVFSWVFSALAFIFFLTLAGFLLQGSQPVLRKEGLDFFLGSIWHYRVLCFGALPMLYGTTVVAVVAILFAAPLAFGSAILTAEYLSGKIRLLVKSLIELLAGIPSVVYGLLGVIYLRPMIFNTLKPFHPETGDNLLSAGLIVGIMILPTIMSLSDDALRGISREDRETALALGLTRYEMFFHAVLPKAFPGLVSAVLLGFGRALGETIAVYLVAGRADNRLPQPWYSLRPLLESGQTLTSKLGGSEVGIAYGNPVHWSAMIGLCLLLFLTVMVFVSVGQGLKFFGRDYGR